MKKYILFLLGIFLIVSMASAQVSEKQINDLIKVLKASNKSENEIKSSINSIIKNPELYNTLWQILLKQSFIGDNKKFKWLDDLNISFKTFESNANPTSSIGFTYDFNYDYAKYTEKGKQRLSQAFSFSAKGNVAFKKNANPNNLLETKINYNYSRFMGGVVKQNDSAIFSKLNEIEDRLVKIKDINSKEAEALWDEFADNLQLSNQYYLGFAPKIAFESNQDFTRTQFTPGIILDLGAKAWNKRSLLAKFNVLDYPFALFRRLTGTDKTFSVYGSTLPTAQLGIEYILPAKDNIRKGLVGELKPFPRFRFETGFKTFISRVKQENIFFSANYRYYKELNASAAINNAQLAEVNYFVMALQSTSGFSVSYANGRLPFDLKNDEVFALGFNYRF